MARLRYIENARTGDPGSVCTHDNKLFFEDENAYIYASASATLDLVATTVAITGNVTVSGSLTTASQTISLNQDLQGTFTVGQDNTGYDVKFYGDTTSKYWLWDESADSVVLVGAMSITGDVTMATTDQINFYDTGAYIKSSTSTQLDIVATTLAFSGAMTADGALAIIGAITISPGAAGTFLDFVLETEWVSGTLINVDGGTGVTFNSDVIGVSLDLATNVTAADDCDITGYKVMLPDLSAATDMFFTGFDLSEAGAITNATNTFTWKGLNVLMPDMTQSSGTLNVYGVFLTGGSYTSGNEYGVYITGINTGIAIAGAGVTGISLPGTYTTAAISIATTLAASADYAILSTTTCATTSATQAHNAFIGTMTGAGAVGRVVFVDLTVDDVAAGGYVNSFKAQMDFATSGSCTGLASVACLEFVSAGAAVSAGTYAILELELVATASYTTDRPTSYIWAQLSGDDTAEAVLEDHTNLITIYNHTDSTGNMWYDNTLRIGIGDDSSWFIPLSTVEGTYTTAYPIVNSLATGAAIDITGPATGIDIGASTAVGINMTGGGVLGIDFNGTWTCLLYTSDALSLIHI